MTQGRHRTTGGKRGMGESEIEDYFADLSADTEAETSGPHAPGTPLTVEERIRRMSAYVSHLSDRVSETSANRSNVRMAAHHSPDVTLGAIAVIATIIGLRFATRLRHRRSISRL